MALSPTQRTLRALREQGRVCEVVEKFNAFAGPHGQRRDLFNIIDVIALDPVRGVVGVQSCGQSFSAHEHKLLEERAQECIDWLSTPGTVLELWSWSKRKLVRGGKAVRWMPRVKEFTLLDFLADNAEWRDVIGYEGVYQVSSTGLVRSLERVIEDRMASGDMRLRRVKGRTLSPGRDSHGYLQVQLYRDRDGGKMHLVHRLVAASFVANPQAKPQINHLDGNPLNNRVENLEWSTSSENNLHATRILGRIRGHTIMTRESVEELRRLYDQGASQNDLAEQFGIKPSTVSNIVSGRRWA